jgi:hypothetical protein
MTCSCRPLKAAFLCVACVWIVYHALPSELGNPVQKRLPSRPDPALDKTKDALIEPKDQRVRRRMLGPIRPADPSPFHTSSPAGRAAVTVAPWTLSVRPTCTPRAGHCARSLPSSASRRPRSAIGYAAAGVTLRRSGPPAHSASTDQIVELHDQGLTWRQVAKQVDMTVSGVWSRYRRARPPKPPWVFLAGQRVGHDAAAGVCGGNAPDSVARSLRLILSRTHICVWTVLFGAELIVSWRLR